MAGASSRVAALDAGAFPAHDDIGYWRDAARRQIKPGADIVAKKLSDNDDAHSRYLRTLIPVGARRRVNGWNSARAKRAATPACYRGRWPPHANSERARRA